MSTPTITPRRVRCPLGGSAPCVDDLCHGSDHTLCGLELDVDFCEHDLDPATCPDCLFDDESYWGQGEAGS